METVRLDSPNILINGQDSGINIAMALSAVAAVLVAAFIVARRCTPNPSDRNSQPR